MATPESLKNTKKSREKVKRGKGGLRGTPELDNVNNTSIIIDPDGRKGHTRIDKNTVEQLIKAANVLKINRSDLTRKVLQSFCMYFAEAKELGGVPFFNTPKTYEAWLQDRTDVRRLLNEITKMNNTMQQNSQSSEVKMLSQMIVALSEMMSLTHKTVL